MKLTLSKPYLSIKGLVAPELPDFAVLFGPNGVGKTQLLDAIAVGAIGVSGVGASGIEKYNIDSFRPNVPNRASWGGAIFAQRTVEAWVGGGGDDAPCERAREIYSRIVGRFGLKDGGDERARFDRHLEEMIRHLPDFTLFTKALPRIGKKPVEDQALRAYAQAIEDEVMALLGTPGAPQNPSDSAGFGHAPAILVSMAMKLSRRLPHELCAEDILRAAHYEGDAIWSDLNQTFIRYKVEQYAYAHNGCEQGQGPVDALLDRFRRENQPPWITLRAIIGRLRSQIDDPHLFHFAFTDPENDRLRFADHHQYSFETELTNLATGDTYSMGDLSSGERVLMSLCLMFLNQALGRRRPRLLLLDEVDAMLHPSMVVALVSALTSLFVDQGTSVLMTTHSCSTAAVLADDEMFRVTRDGGQVTVQAASKQDAVFELSDGVATLDAGLRLAASNAPVTILTEGNNALHLTRWARLFFPGQVEVFDGLTRHTSASELLAYSRLLAAVRADTHFLIVWDCDASKMAAKLKKALPPDANVTPFAFSSRENPISPKGIENKYEFDLLQPYANRITTMATGEEVALSFPGDEKARFAEYIREHGTREDFAHFNDLTDQVRLLLSHSGRSGDT